MALNMELSTEVRVGNLVTNFEEYKQALKDEMDSRFNHLVVTDESLRECKDMLARLRKVEKQIREQYKSAKDEYCKPLELPKKQADELVEIVTQSIMHLDRQVKEIEEAQRAGRREAAMEVFAKECDTGGYSDEVVRFATGCLHWIVREQWANKTYTDARIREDSREALENIRTALSLFQGEFRAQMLARFRESGSVAQAAEYGTRLKAESIPVDSNTKQNTEIGIIAEPAPEPQEEFPRTEVLPSPENYLTGNGTDRKVCTGYFRVTGPRYQLMWLMDLANDWAGLNMEKLTAEDIKATADRLRAKENRNND